MSGPLGRRGLEGVGMSVTSVEYLVVETRTAARSSLYLGAALYCDGCSTAARIRNMSADGALIEAAVVPDVGSLVQLVRGRLIVHGLVIWSADGKCGVKFSSRVDVQQWRSAPTDSEQQRVDDVVRLVKAGAVPLPVATHGDGESDRGEHMAAGLMRVTKLLNDLSDVLAGDPDMVSRHGAALQNLDIAVQVIAAMQSIEAGRIHEVGDDLKLAGVRGSAD